MGSELRILSRYLYEIPDSLAEIEEESPFSVCLFLTFPKNINENLLKLFDLG